MLKQVQGDGAESVPPPELSYTAQFCDDGIMPGRFARFLMPFRHLGAQGDRSGVSLLDSVNCVNLVTLAFLAVALLTSSPVSARDSLGVYSSWAAFRDPLVPRCYAIAMAEPSTLKRDYQPYADVGIWPRRGVRSQVHFRLSRKLAANSRITLSIAGQRFELTGGGGDAWAADRRMDAAIVAAMRSARSMTVSARDAAGRRFANTYLLAGGASAMDSAAIGCARLR